MGNNSKITTRDIVKDFAGYKFRRSGYENRAGGKSVEFEPPTSVHRHMRVMGDQFETAYFNSFDDMTNQISVHDDNLREVVVSVLDSTFSGGIAWGRIVGAIVFASRLAVKAQAANRPDTVSKVVEWTIEYLEQPAFDNWINQHGGWAGFSEFYKNPTDRRAPANDVQFPWTKAYAVGVNVINGAASFFNAFMG